MSDRRVLIVAFDALRPDMVTPATMPTLCRLADEGVRFNRSRATFPTETRVNQTALVTGARPARHGIVGNRFLEPVAAPGRLFNTGDDDQLADGTRRLGGRLTDVPVLAQMLAAAGRTLAVVSSGTPGGTRMLNHKAEELGQFRLSLHRPDASVPKAAIAEVIARVGPIPPHVIPSLSWLGYTTDVYLDYIEPMLHPDVAILWYCEPDNSYHYKGLGSPDNLAALARADAELARLLAWRERAGLADELQIVTMSDHGQITVAAEAIGLAAAMSAAGFEVAETLSDGADAALALSSAGGIYVRDSDPDLIARIVAWLQAQPWCGPVFTAYGDTALPRAALAMEHRRSPDIALALASDDRPNAYGITGRTQQNARYPVGGGLHGGLHSFELHNWLAMSGSAFRSALVCEAPCGVIDVLPSVLSVLGLSAPPTVEGRVLSEAFAGQAASTPPWQSGQLSASGAAGHVAHLRYTDCGEVRYLDRAWVER